MTVEEIADFYNVPKKMLSAKDNSFTFNQNSMSHSPAPWKFQDIHHDYDPPNCTRKTLVDANGYSVILPYNNNPHDLALIQSAPDLLEALKLAIDHDNMIRDADPYYRIPDSVRVVIDAAISKANEI